jgi:fatty acid desaturase (delta-4 desaturase)
MPPDADTLRQRHTKNDSTVSTTTTAADEQQQQQLRTLNSLLPTEVAVDGIIYDLTSFHHPGGEQIYMMGGNDVTVQYKMIHPHHKVGDGHLQKMKRVGKVVDHHCEYVA